MKPDLESQEKQEGEKEKKITEFQNRLNKIRSAALWLDHITQEHTDDAKRRRVVIQEVDDNMKFLHEKLLHEKHVRS